MCSRKICRQESKSNKLVKISILSAQREKKVLILSALVVAHGLKFTENWGVAGGRRGYGMSTSVKADEL